MSRREGVHEKVMTANAPVALELRGLTKQFGSVLANVGVNLRVEAGKIHGVIGENGAGVLLVSSELDEILTLSDRILVMFEGGILAEFRRGEVTERELGLKMGGA